MSISIREIHDENEFVEEVPVTFEFQRAPEGTAGTNASGIPLSISKQVEMEIDIWKRLQGSWMEVEDFNPRPDGMIGRSGLQATSLRFHKSVFTWQRFNDDKDLGNVLAGSFRVGANSHETSPRIEFNCESLPSDNTEVLPSEEFGKYVKRTLSGPITLDGDQLTIRLTESIRPPGYLGELPREWKFRRTIPVSNQNAPQPSVGPYGRLVPGSPPIRSYPQPELSPAFKKLSGQWIQAEEIGEKGLGGMRLNLDGDQYRLTRDHNSQGVRYQLGGTYDAAEGVDGSPNTIYFSHTVQGGDAGTYSSPGPRRIGGDPVTVPTIRRQQSFSGTYELEGDRLTLHIDKGPNAPDFVGIPATWVFHRPPGSDAKP